jgi:diguanylate cyclase (GGDEF)-like protein
MSFRTRLISFFVLIVVLPMIGVGVLVYRLIGDSAQGKADARANGLVTAAATLYERETVLARADARSIARDGALLNRRLLASRLPRIASRAGLARVTVTEGPRTIADVGDRTAVAPGVAHVHFTTGAPPVTVTVSEITANQYAHDLASNGSGLLVRQGVHVLASTVLIPRATALPSQGNVTLDGTGYREATANLRGFGSAPVKVTALSSLAATAASVTPSRVLAAAFIVAFLILALAFSLLASRALQDQLGRFLSAARRLAGGDFSSRIHTQGRDEFAALGEEFNNMSNELARRLEELTQERVRLREAIRRIGQTFASNLDRAALLDLALKTAIDATRAECGRVSAREHPEQPLTELQREGTLAGFERGIHAAERAALASRSLEELSDKDIHVVSVPLGIPGAGGRSRGVITVGRGGHAFSDDERELLRSLAAQTALALENVELHFQVRRQAVTDELTGLANHRRFQELLGAEIDQVRRYHHPLGLIMLDIDDFKLINDTYGHQQGDAVLRAVARVVQANSRDADSPARYGGEEMALILPHTDLDGAYAIAERVRSAIEHLRVPRIDGQGTLHATASAGVAATTDGDQNALVADADAALYEAKRQGKNRATKAAARAADVLNAE